MSALARPRARGDRPLPAWRSRERADRLELDYVVSLLRAEARSRSRTDTGPSRFRAPARPAERRA